MPSSFYEHRRLASVYDAWHPRSIRDDYDFYLPHVMASHAVLDVGCGTGTLLREARAAGHAGLLCGIDPAPGVLEIARACRSVEWTLGDLRHQGWEQRFDLVMMTGHAFQEVVADEELKAFMAAVERSLAPGGRFAFETRNPLARGWERWTPRDGVHVTLPDGTPVRIDTRIDRAFDGRTVAFIHVFSSDRWDAPESSTSILRFLGVDEIDRLLGAAGLVVEARYGGFDSRALDAASPEIVTLARKP